MSTLTSQPTPASEPTSLCCGMDMPPPTKEHEWLQRLVGDWDLDIEMVTGPGQPTMKSKGFDRSRMVGNYWLVSEGKNNEFPYECRLTLGFDSEKKKYVGTWLDSMSGYLWHYVGSVDASGKRLTLETEGPFPPGGGKLTKFREVTEFKAANHRVFTSARLDESGAWVTQLRIDFRRRA